MNICGKVMTYRNLFMGKNMKMMTKDCYKRTVQRFCTSVLTQSNKYDPKKEKNEFLKTLPTIIDDLSKHQKFQEIPEAEKWMRKVLNGTLVGGKYARGLTTVMSYIIIENPENVTEEALRLARTLGWCTEILQAYYLVLDDIADGSATRRGLPCWYRREDVGIANATNDAVLIHACLQQILQANFARSPFYVDLIHNFGETLLFSSIGQNIDIMTGPYKKNYNSFTIDKYNTLVEHKSAYYTYKLPITLGIMLANKINDETLKNAQEISMQLGRLFQMQDDYIDCYGDEKLTGKMGTDIQEGKCSWLAINALQRCKANQRAVFNACYGSKEPAHIERIKQLYNQLKIPQLYTEEENKIYNHIIQRIQTVSSDTERELYLKVLNDTYGRKR